MAVTSVSSIFVLTIYLHYIVEPGHNAHSPAGDAEKCVCFFIPGKYVAF